LKRFFLFHFQFPFLICGFIILHLFYLHFLSSVYYLPQNHSWATIKRIS
jgi:quinol-cytochrome oxidoreductase complex cytochrome b subunit